MKVGLVQCGLGRCNRVAQVTEVLDQVALALEVALAKLGQYVA